MFPSYLRRDANAYGIVSSYRSNTPAEVVEGWMNSPEHRVNILDPGFCRLGVGCEILGERTYRVQLPAARLLPEARCSPLPIELPLSGPHGCHAGLSLPLSARLFPGLLLSPAINGILHPVPQKNSWFLNGFSPPAGVSWLAHQTHVWR